MSGNALGSIAGKLRREGPRGVVRRVVRRAYQQLDARALDFGLLPEDIADSTRLELGPVAPVPSGRPLVVGWLTTPPAAGSGGHTTMFRMVEALEQAGHRCVVLLYDRHHGSAAAQAAVIRDSWPTIRAEVRSVDDGFDGLDACVATGWESAHVLAVRPTRPLHRLYFIQDYEPLFSPRGSEYELAADTYRFGFTNIALGEMVRSRLHDDLGVASELVPFSCDTSVYSLHNRGPRSGIVFYAKPGLARRGYLLGTIALAEFHQRHPEQPIHVYGSPVPELGIPVVHHGRLTPGELNALYNRCIAGVAMSFTNISLVAEEMLAAGCVPVVNASPDARADLDNPHVGWAPPTPGGIADALSDAVEAADIPGRAAAAAGSVRTDNWARTREGVRTIIENTVHGAPVDWVRLADGAGAAPSPS
ncbi:glycosyltransferase family 1 protein [Nocardioides sp. CCNWLW239]|uniref:rhamnosyltransferase WsaF family glycosyltransferase n=1 Tax=Nocardioides sp. CCNWLW239 TaxID=3128902 RepID=UPI003016C748